MANSPVVTNTKHWKKFGCSVYKTTDTIQQGKPYHKWKDTASVCIYLGPSLVNCRAVSISMNAVTGLLSPQIYIKLYTAFNTVADLYPNNEIKYFPPCQLKAVLLTVTKKTLIVLEVQGSTGTSDNPPIESLGND